MVKKIRERASCILHTFFQSFICWDKHHFIKGKDPSIDSCSNKTSCCYFLIAAECNLESAFPLISSMTFSYGLLLWELHTTLFHSWKFPSTFPQKPYTYKPTLFLHTWWEWVGEKEKELPSIIEMKQNKISSNISTILKENGVHGFQTIPW